MRSQDYRFAIVASRFNSLIVDRLVQGALEALEKTGSKIDDVTVVRVPGSFELPVAAKHLADSRKFDAVIALGCVMRGETPHFEFIAAETTRGLGQVALETGVPVTFGVLTVDTELQAEARSGPGSDNKGFEAAMAAVEMAHLLKRL